MNDARDLLARYLRQRADLGEVEIHLDTLTPTTLRALLATRSGRAGTVSTVAGSAPTAESVPVSQAGGAEIRPRPAAPARDGGGEHGADPASRPRGAAIPDGSILQVGSLAELRELALGCPRCRLCETRNRVVFGEGRENAELMIVGEAPGAEEDRTGRPFVGRAGRLLDLLLASVGFSRDAVYICNVLKCRPPGNRNPETDEIESCDPYLRKQVELVAPRAILAVGGFAAQTLLGVQTPIGRLRGTDQVHEGVPLVPTYHPAALLRNPVLVRPVWEDLQRLRTVLDRG
jgi:uracil-DNA glycosylase